MLNSTGILNYSFNSDYGYKLIVNIDQSIANYYFKLIPKWFYAQSQMYRAHISVVRKEIPVYLGNWELHEGKEVPFSYDPSIKMSETYFWLNVVSQEIDMIRKELGLSNETKFPKPAGFNKYYHITIGNRKK